VGVEKRGEERRGGGGGEEPVSKGSPSLTGHQKRGLVRKHEGGKGRA